MTAGRPVLSRAKDPVQDRLQHTVFLPRGIITLY